MKLSLKIAKILVRLIAKEVVPASSAKSKLIENLVEENILLRQGKHRRTLKLINEESLRVYLANQLQILNLEEYILTLEKEGSSRAALVKITTNSKITKKRVFKGFLINSYHTIIAELNNKEFKINPLIGSFIFIYDFENFKIPKEVTVVGIENAENFSQIHQQKYLFKNIIPLFVSRYPQNQHKDFIKWMQSIPNNYLHFGDFDMAGIGIYINEYKKYLAEKASFFIPKMVETDIHKNGNRERYDIQNVNFSTEGIQEPKLLNLIKIIHLERKGLDQEYYIKFYPLCI